MRTDTIFYQLFQSYPQLLFELLGLSPEIASTYQFTSVEVKEKAFRFDGVFVPDHPDNCLWFVEVQFQKVETFYSELFTEIFIYLNQYRPVSDWRAAVIFPSRKVEPEVGKHYQELYSSGRVRVIYLDELSEHKSPLVGLTKLMICSEFEAVELAKQVVEKQPDLLEFVLTILVYKLKDRSREEIERMFSLGDLKQTKVYQEAKEEGFQLGKQEEAAKIGRNLLKLAMPPEQVADITGLPRLGSLVDRRLGSLVDRRLGSLVDRLDRVIALHQQ
ncbi:MAG: Rpn family recombination-promoting nuclease/putative transposase [Pseudanabaenaceae cyanobacterium SKYGB_i_bin29]|nr:Rpn family recombination-promoting nuclease/putative transposase [Pseudanabaenaceae cyanobacterium SKYG29]MDW8422654.1 Rpn family recombination-promoting nuclease/putative transposase [Pseudanabaenaceae cyanobacterium SKYGB_i_bin29]